MQINLIVIRTSHPKTLSNFYEQLGMEFEYHQHGKGAWHYSTEIGATVFEIISLIPDCIYRICPSCSYRLRTNRCKSNDKYDQTTNQSGPPREVNLIGKSSEPIF